MSIAERFSKNNSTGNYHNNFCFKTIKEKVVEKCVHGGQWGPDGDIMYWFEDGSMLLERRVVREFQLFKGG